MLSKEQLQVLQGLPVFFSGKKLPFSGQKIVFVLFHFLAGVTSARGMPHFKEVALPFLACHALMATIIHLSQEDIFSVLFIDH